MCSKSSAKTTSYHLLQTSRIPRAASTKASQSAKNATCSVTYWLTKTYSCANARKLLITDRNATLALVPVHQRLGLEAPHYSIFIAVAIKAMAVVARPILDWANLPTKKPTTHTLMIMEGSLTVWVQSPSQQIRPNHLASWAMLSRDLASWPKLQIRLAKLLE